MCDVETDLNTRWRLQYDVYQYFLPENDLSEQSLISGMETVATVPGMVENGRKVRSKEAQSLQSHTLETLSLHYYCNIFAHGYLLMQKLCENEP